jgi:hypothetical protein
MGVVNVIWVPLITKGVQKMEFELYYNRFNWCTYDFKVWMVVQRILTQAYLLRLTLQPPRGGSDGPAATAMAGPL